MKKIIGVVILIVGLACPSGSRAEAVNSEKLSRMLQQSTLTLLKEGNLRYAGGKSLHPNLESARRAELAAAGQEPLATVLACSDSREPVELIFDRGVGDVFVVRVAGNVAGLSELATIEYGVTHLNTPVLLVMGHSQCGAVTAAVQGGELHGHLPALISLIKPAVDKARVSVAEEELVPHTIELNVWQQVENIFARSALIRAAVAAGNVTIVGAVYDIVSGQVHWLGQHPEMERLVAEAKAQQLAAAPAHVSDHAAVAPAVAVTPTMVVPVVSDPAAPATVAAPDPTGKIALAKQAQSHLPASLVKPGEHALTSRPEAAPSHH